MTNRNEIKDTIVNLLVKRRELTRPELTLMLGTRPATLFDIIDELKAAGVAVEPDRGNKRTGRRASPIRLNSKLGYFVGVDLQIRHTIGVVVDLAGNVIASAGTVSPPNKNAVQSRREAAELVEGFRKKLGKDWETVKGLGFADPGLVDIERGFSIKAVNIDGWRDLDNKGWLEELFAVPALVYPAAAARAFMEYLNLYPDQPKSLYHMELATGIGSGFVKQGRVFVGDTNCGMEVGHVIIQPNGPLCQCGNRGCLEALAGEAGIRRKIQELNANDVQTKLRIEDFSTPGLVQRVRERDKAAMSLANDICENIGMGLSTVVALLNPSTVIFSGELTGLGELLLDTVRRVLSFSCFPAAVKNLTLKISDLAENGSALGAALLARDKFINAFNQPD